MERIAPTYMGKILQIGLTITILTFILGAFAGCETKEILKRMEKHSKSLKSLRADLTMESYNSQLKETDTIKGKLIYVPLKGRAPLVRIDWIKPVQESLGLVDKQYIYYRPRLNMAIVGKTNNLKSSEINEALAFMNVSKDYLKANYNIKYIGKEKISNGILTHHLEFTPKVRKNYKTAEFWADDNGMPIQMKVVLDNNDSIKVLFTNIKKNIAVDINAFKINLPKNTKIIRN